MAGEAPAGGRDSLREPGDRLQVGAPEAALGLVGMALALSLFHPQAAYPLNSLVQVAMLLGAFALALSGRDAGLPRLAAGLGGMFLAFAWWNGSRGPVPVYGWEDASHVLQFALACGAVMSAGAGLAPGRRAVLARAAVLSVAALLAVESAWGVYQSAGPAGWPRTYATMAVEYGAELDANDMIGEGLRHALAEARAAGTLGAPNVFAGMAAAGAVLGLGGFLAERGRLRAACAGAVLACGAGVWLSGSRGGLLALGLGVLALVAWNGTLARVRARAAAAAILLLVLLHPAEGSAAGGHARSRWLGHTTVVQRLRYWESGLSMWREAPLLGRGAGAYRVLYPSHRVEGAGETQFAHNWFVQGLAECGVAGVALRVGGLGLLLLLAGRGALAAARDGDGARACHTAALGGGALTLLAHGLLDYTLETREGMLLLGVLLGAGAAGAPGGSGTLRGGARALLCATAIAAFAILHVRPVMHEIHVENAAAVLSAGGDSPVEVRQWLGDAFDGWPGDPRGAAFRARYAMSLGDAGAAALFERAAELNPWSASAQEELAYARLGLGDREGALAAISRANELHPLDPTHWLSRAEIEGAAGNAEGARAALARARGLPRNPQEETRLRALEERLK